MALSSVLRKAVLHVAGEMGRLKSTQSVGRSDGGFCVGFSEDERKAAWSVSVLREMAHAC